MKIVTDHVFPDEDCHGLFEGPRTVPRNGRRWIQAVYVVRGDSIAEYTEDYGPAENFSRAQPLVIPSFGENTVAQLQDMAECNRHDRYWANRADEMLAESTLIEDHLRQLEQGRELVRNRSSFGAGGNFQRNGYPRKAAREAHG